MFPLNKHPKETLINVRSLVCGRHVCLVCKADEGGTSRGREGLGDQLRGIYMAQEDAAFTTQPFLARIVHAGTSGMFSQ